ncbi:MAG TPA: 2,3-bisphosphoglycerate-independent phosphoglycerate mutase [Anaerolineales bacterium]|nr:2,3-bisphosphoglycerate-independent phosphoglycerate mutase [Anaerolineales bacterium]
MARIAALIIMDGLGIREKQDYNAVVQAVTPNYDFYMKNHERSILDASGEAVGLVDGQMGNSEVGHLNLGAGFVVAQDIRRIDIAIEDGSFFKDPILIASFKKLKESGKALHVLGLLGPGGVHSHIRHLFALIKFANQEGVTPKLHLITDGRDTPPNSGITFLQDLKDFLKDYQADIVTVSGRYYAMDRDKRWERTQLAYQAITFGEGITAPTADEAFTQSYEQDVTDEFIKPTVVDDSYTGIDEGDFLLFYNFRADRMRQIVASYFKKDFDGFKRDKGYLDVNVITFTEYSSELETKILFPAHEVKNPLAKVLSDASLKQFHCAETEKYAHVTYFFNGGREEPFPGEERLMVPSPKVATYDLQPEMSAYELTEKLLDRIKTQDDNFIIVNFANPDMVGHTGDLAAATKAVETVDKCVGKVVSAIVEKGGTCIVTADHGNAEQMLDLITGEPHTYHTINPVSCFVIGNGYYELIPRGKLADIAPTILDLLGLEKHSDMTGRSLVKRHK